MVKFLLHDLSLWTADYCSYISIVFLKPKQSNKKERSIIRPVKQTFAA